MADVSPAGGERRPRPSLRMYGLAAALTIANPLVHKSVSNVADWLSARWGFAWYDRVSLIAIPLVSIAVALPLVARGRAFLTRPTIVALLGVLLALTAAAQHWLLVVNVELVHLPQFALIAVILLAGGATGMSAFLLAGLAGVVDETYQHLVIYAETPGTYFDVNDIVLNAIGAAWGVVLVASLSRRPVSASDRERWTARQWAGVIAIGGLALAAAWWWDPPVFSPLLRTSPAHPFYRVLSLPEGLVACALLAGIVNTAWNQRADGRSTLPAAAVPSLLAILSMVMTGCASASGVPVAAAPEPRGGAAATAFITTFWCGPPLDEFDDRRAREIAEAGFSIVGPPCEHGGAVTTEGNRRALEVAARHGLSLWVADPRYSERARGQPGWEEALDAAVNDYRGFSSLGGYFVTDEPSPAQFPDLQAIVGRLRMRDPDRLAYINLNPDYAFGTDAERAYPIYVDQFIDAVQPALLSYDYYALGVNGDRSTFFRNLALIRDRSERHRIPFLLIVLAMPHARYRDPSEAELSWQAYHAVAYGAAGISYFAYWTPVDVAFQDRMQFRHGLIEKGVPTRHYHEAARLNVRLRAIAAELSGFRSVTVRDSAGEVAERLPFDALRGISGGPVTVGFFRHDDGRRIAMLVNRDYKAERTVTVTLEKGIGNVDAFDAESRRWTRLRANDLRIAGGGALLLKWRGTT